MTGVSAVPPKTHTSPFKFTPLTRENNFPCLSGMVTNLHEQEIGQEVQTFFRVFSRPCQTELMLWAVLQSKFTGGTLAPDVIVNPFGQVLGILVGVRRTR